MMVYVYETSGGLIADFRAYLDGQDHAFEPPRLLRASDPRWEKVRNTNCPHTGKTIDEDSRFVGMGEIDDYHELMIFPIPYKGAVESTSEPAPDSPA